MPELRRHGWKTIALYPFQRTLWIPGNSRFDPRSSVAQEQTRRSRNRHRPWYETGALPVAPFAGRHYWAWLPKEHAWSASEQELPARSVPGRNFAAYRKVQESIGHREKPRLFRYWNFRLCLPPLSSLEVQSSVVHSAPRTCLRLRPASQGRAASQERAVLSSGLRFQVLRVPAVASGARDPTVLDSRRQEIPVASVPFALPWKAVAESGDSKFLSNDPGIWH